MTAVIAVKGSAFRCYGHKASVGSTVSDLETMNTADLPVQFVDVLIDGTLNRSHLSGGIAACAGSINFPVHVVNRCRMCCAVLGIGVVFQNTGDADTDYGRDPDHLNAVTYGECISNHYSYDEAVKYSPKCSGDARQMSMFRLFSKDRSDDSSALSSKLAKSMWAVWSVSFSDGSIVASFLKSETRGGDGEAKVSPAKTRTKARE